MTRSVVLSLARVNELLKSIRGGPGHRGPATDHFDGRRFFNPAAQAGPSLRDLLRWRMGARPRRWPEWVENHARAAPASEIGSDELVLTFINHVTFLIQLPGLNILTDPVWSERASPFRSFGPRRVRSPGIALEALPPIDVVLVSHNHYDHLDVRALKWLDSAHRPLFLAGMGNRAFLRGLGPKQVRELDWWQRLETPRAAFTMTPAQHWSARNPRNRNRTLWGGFHVQAGRWSVLFAGDSGYCRHFLEIRRRLGPVGLALLPIGAYAPRWFMAPQHLDPEGAVRAHLDLDAEVSVGMHFGCFQLTDEGLEDPVIELAAARERRGVPPERFQVLETGETRRFGLHCQPVRR